MLVDHLEHQPTSRAQRLLDAECIFVDIEATGLGPLSQVIEIAILRHTGEVVLETLIKPDADIPRDIAKQTGISNEMVANAPTWREVQPLIERAMRGHAALIWNAEFDLRLLQQTSSLNGMRFDIDSDQVFCSMKLYSAFWGDFDKKNERFRWQKLANAAAQQHLQYNSNQRGAMIDCRVSLALIIEIASGRASTVHDSI